MPDHLLKKGVGWRSSMKTEIWGSSTEMRGWMNGGWRQHGDRCKTHRATCIQQWPWGKDMISYTYAQVIARSLVHFMIYFGKGELHILCSICAETDWASYAQTVVWSEQICALCSIFEETFDFACLSLIVETPSIYCAFGTGIGAIIILWCFAHKVITTIGALF